MTLLMMLLTTATVQATTKTVTYTITNIGPFSQNANGQSNSNVTFAATGDINATYTVNLIRGVQTLSWTLGDIKCDWTSSSTTFIVGQNDFKCFGGFYIYKNWTFTISSDTYFINHVMYYNHSDELSVEQDGNGTKSIALTTNNNDFDPIGGIHAFTVTLSDIPLATWSGSGTQADPWIIESAEQLAELRNNVNNGTPYYGMYFKQTANIDCQNNTWSEPIGKDNSHPFGGHYDGDNKTIKNFKFSSSTCQYAGLFGYVLGEIYNGSSHKETTLKNIVLEDCDIQTTASSSSAAGIFAGNPGTSYTCIDNCRVSGTISGVSYAGGIIKDSGPNIFVTNCFADVTVSATNKGKIFACINVNYSDEHILGNYYHDDGDGKGYGGNNYNLGTSKIAPVYTVNATGFTTAATNATVTHAGKLYFLSGATTFTPPSNTAFKTFSVSGATYSLAADKKSATVTIGSTDATVTATLQTLSGSCGNNATWTLAQDGSGNYTCLTISGTGAIRNYGHDNASIWRTDADWGYDLTSVTVGDGITRIGEFAFCGCQNLASVTIGSGVKEIAKGAINHCDQMTQITLPTVTTVGEGAFENSAKLQRIDFGHNKTVTLATSNAFNAKKLQYITFPSPAGIVANTATSGNWSGYATKLRTPFGGYLFSATNEGGTAAYKIATEDDLCQLATAVNAGNTGSGQTFRQTADIALSQTFTPIGAEGTNNKWFGGKYDGGNHAISGLSVSGDYDYAGLFGYVDYGTVRNVILVSPTVTSTKDSSGSICVGALTGTCYDATIENCHAVSPTVSATGNGSGAKYIGALIGEFGNRYDKATNCYYYDGNQSNAIGLIAQNATVTNVGRARKVTLGSGIASVSPDATTSGNGFVYNNKTYYREGVTLTLPNNAPKGYAPNYSANGTAFNGDTYTVNSNDGDVTFTVADGIAPIIYTITYYPNGGSLTTDKNSYTVEIGEITLETPTREGYTFFGWYDNAGLTGTAVTTIDAGSTGDKQFWAKWGIPYIDAEGNSQFCYNATALTNSTDISHLSAGWYAVTKDVSYSRQFYCRNGDIHLILCDGAKMTVDIDTYNTAIFIYGGSLSIYAQSTGSSMGRLEATASSFEGINADGSVTICGGNITATGSNRSTPATGNNHKEGIYASKDITIHSGQISASAGNGFHAKNITLGLRNVTDRIYASSYNGTVNIAQGQTFCDENNTPYSGNNVSIPSGKTLRLVQTLNLSDNGNNAEAIGEAAAASTGGWVHNVTLSSRTIYRDGDWNTLCLPFALSESQIAASPLSGATIMELDGTRSDLTNGTLTLNFNTATEMEAGRPYIVKWPLARVISSPSDWHDFAVDVAGGNTYEGKMVWLAADIEVSEMVGTSEHKFKGIFDGQGHTLQLNSLSASGEAACAPFRYVEGTTITNLHTTGTVIADNNTASKFRSGLVGQSYGNTVISNCRSSVTISSSISGDGTHGGFIGVSNSGNATISNCRFDGSFSGSTTTCWGGFVGWSNSTITISNSVFAPEGISIDHTSSATFSRNKVTTKNCYYSVALNDVTNDATAIGSTSANDLAEDLGSGWQVKEGKAVPVTAARDIVNPVFTGVTVETGLNDVAFTSGSFKGTYAPMSWDAEDRSILFLGEDNTIYYPQAGAHVNACRAYFHLNDPTLSVREFNLHFGEEETDGIGSIQNSKLKNQNSSKADAWYTLDGRRISAPSDSSASSALPKGVYIHNGKKVVIK